MLVVRPGETRRRTPISVIPAQAMPLQDRPFGPVRGLCPRAPEVLENQRRRVIVGAKVSRRRELARGEKGDAPDSPSSPRRRGSSDHFCEIPASTAMKAMIKMMKMNLKSRNSVLIPFSCEICAFDAVSWCLFYFVQAGLRFHSPDLPPALLSSLISLMTIPRSIALHMS